MLELLKVFYSTDSLTQLGVYSLLTILIVNLVKKNKSLFVVYLLTYFIMVLLIYSGTAIYACLINAKLIVPIALFNSLIASIPCFTMGMIIYDKFKQLSKDEEFQKTKEEFFKIVKENLHIKGE